MSGTTKNISPHFYVSCPAFRLRTLTCAHENARIWSFARLACPCFPLPESYPRTRLRPCTLPQCTAKSFSITYSLYTAQRNPRNSRNPGSGVHKRWYRRECICTQEQRTKAGGEAGLDTGFATGRVTGYGGHARTADIGSRRYLGSDVLERGELLRLAE